MQALVTRPVEDAQATAELLRQRGFDVLIEPLMQVVQTPEHLPSLEGVQAFLATSANGVRALAQATDRRDIGVWAVGDASARAATELGFTSVHSANGDVDSLTWLVMSKLSPQNGKLLHVAGTEVAGDLGGALAHASYQVERVMLYHTTHATHFAPATVAALAAGSINAALFYSPRTAQLFTKILTQTGIPANLSRSWAFALSPAVAAKLAPLPWAGIQVALEPTQTQLMAALDQTNLQADPT